MEYLMTYGWGIIAIIVLGIVLWQLGYLNYESGRLSHTGFNKLKPMLSGTGYGSNGIFTSVFINAAGKEVVITGIELVDDITNTTLCCSSQHLQPTAGGSCSHGASDIGGANFDDFAMVPNPQGSRVGPLIMSGRNFKMELGRVISGGGSNSAVDTCHMPGLAKGDRFRVRMVLYYDLLLNEVPVSKVDSGILNGILE